MTQQKVTDGRYTNCNGGGGGEGMGVDSAGRRGKCKWVASLDGWWACNMLFLYHKQTPHLRPILLRTIANKLDQELKLAFQ